MQRQAMGVAPILSYFLNYCTIRLHDADFDESAFFCLLFISVYPLRVHPMTGGKYDDTYLFAPLSLNRFLAILFQCPIRSLASATHA